MIRYLILKKIDELILENLEWKPEIQFLAWCMLAAGAVGLGATEQSKQLMENARMLLQYVFDFSSKQIAGKLIITKKKKR